MAAGRRASVAAVFAIAALVAPIPLEAAATTPASPVVWTETGAVRGTVGADARVFQGIPFAAPPVGALRWQAPRPAAAWSGVRDATRPASPCPQVPVPVLPGPSNRTGSTDEDCLYLNVWTPPAIPARRMPVFVWLHGGSNIFGAGSDYNGRGSHGAASWWSPSTTGSARSASWPTPRCPRRAPSRPPVTTA